MATHFLPQMKLIHHENNPFPLARFSPSASDADGWARAAIKCCKFAKLLCWCLQLPAVLFRRVTRREKASCLAPAFKLVFIQGHNFSTCLLLLGKGETANDAI